MFKMMVESQNLHTYNEAHPIRKKAVISADVGNKLKERMTHANDSSRSSDKGLRIWPWRF